MVLNRPRVVGTLSALALLALANSAAHAQTNLAVNGVVNPPPTISLGTQTLLNTTSALFTATNAGQTINGTLFSAVARRGDGQLDFFYQFVNTAPSTVEITSISIANFAGFDTAVAQTTDNIDGDSTNFVAGGISSNLALRPQAAGVQFLFPGVPVGSTSTTLLIRTNATDFSFNGGASLQSGAGVAANTVGQVIAAGSVGVAAPEPGTVALLGTGVLGMAGMVARRRRAK